MATVEIVCTHCGAEAFLTREPVYEGFRKIGEELSCSACGGRFGSEADVPFKAMERGPQLFSKGDLPPEIRLFAADENSRLCRYCAEYLVNPFVQYCSLHKKEVQATDTCSHFVPASLSR